MRPCILILCFLLIFSCKKIDFQIQNLNGNKIGVIGHGGSGFRSSSNPYPHNSYSSILQALYAFQADGVEMDVQMSSDNTLMLFHNDLLETATNCSGCIHQYNASTLEGCSYSNESTIGDENLIRLEKILTLFTNTEHKPIFILDVRSSFPCADGSFDNDAFQNELADKVASTIESYSGAEHIFIESGDSVFLDKLHHINSSLRLIFDGEISNELVQAAVAKGYFAVGTHNEEASAEDVVLAHRNNLRVVLYGVKTWPNTKDAVLKNPDYIETENIELLQNMLY